MAIYSQYKNSSRKRSGAEKRRALSNIYVVQDEITLRKEKVAKQKNPEKDERMAIHDLIVMCINQGKTTEEILQELKSKYNNSKLSQYYEGYIADHRKKIEKSKESKSIKNHGKKIEKSKDDEGR